MIKTLMNHKVKDFATWKKAFDDFAQVRRSAGELSYSVGRSLEEPNNVYVINEWKSTEDFQAFMKRPELAEAMRNAGVMEEPHTIILDVNDNGSLN